MNLVAVTESAIATGLQRLHAASAVLANPSSPADVDPAREVVELMESKRQVQLGAAVLRRAFDTQGSLLDIFGGRRERSPLPHR